MQKTFILLGAILLACSAQAQTTDRNNNIEADSSRYGMHRYERHRDGARRDGAQRVHYTPEQRGQIRDINKDYHKKAADLFNNDNLTLRQYKAGLIALQKDKKSKLQALLTPEQKERLAKGRERRAEKRQVMAAARMERLKIRLNLTDQQVATLRTKEESLHTQLKAIHENDDLLPQQKMEQYKELMGKRKETVKSVLTPDQLTKFSEMESAREGRGDREHRPMQGMREGMREEGK